MNHEELLAEYQRLQAEVERLKQHAAQLETENSQLREQLKEAEQLIAQLRRELFGPKADKLTAEQEEQLKALNKDLEADAQSPPPVSDQILVREEPASRRKQKPKPLRSNLKRRSAPVAANRSNGSEKKSPKSSI